MVIRYRQATHINSLEHMFSTSKSWLLNHRRLFNMREVDKADEDARGPQGFQSHNDCSWSRSKDSQELLDESTSGYLLTYMILDIDPYKQFVSYYG